MSEIRKTPKNNGVVNSKSSLLRVFRSSLPTDGSMFYEHHHTAFEITMVLKGSGIYATRASEFNFKSGDIFFFSTDEYHWIKKLIEDTDFLNIHFEPRYVWSDNFGIAGGELTRIFLNRKNNPHNKIGVENEVSPAVCSLIYKMEKEADERKKEYEIKLKIHLVDILVELIRSYDGQIEKNDVTYTTEILQEIENAIAYMDEHLTEDITLEEISDVAHMSKNYFCRQFKKLNGISPWEYITVKRIERAIRYIENTDHTRLEIASKCGYNNASNIYHAFIKVTGKAPGDYKNYIL